MISTKRKYERRLKQFKPINKHDSEIGKVATNSLVMLRAEQELYFIKHKRMCGGDFVCVFISA